MANIYLHFGAMSDRIDQQIAAQGWRPRSATVLATYQKEADALTRLNVRGLLTDSATRAARTKLMKKICRLQYERVQPNP